MPEPNRNPYLRNIPRTSAVIYLEACGYEEATAKEMIKDYTYGKFVDPEAVPTHVNSAILNGYDEVQWMMQECCEEFGA